MQYDIKKCKFHTIKIMYFDLIIFCNNIKMNLIKIKTIVDWESSQNVYDVWVFFRFANFYQWFIQYFSKIVWSLMNLMKKITKFLWNITCEHVFNDLKKQFTIVLIFAYFNSDFECVFKADSSDHAQKDVLLQYNKDSILYSIVFFS